MINTYSIRFYKNNSRVAPARLDAADARLFYRQLQALMKTYQIRYGQNLSDDSILITIDERIIYRRRRVLASSGVETIEDLMEYLEIDPINRPKYIIANNMIVVDVNTKILGIYVLQFIRGEDCG